LLSEGQNDRIQCSLIGFYRLVLVATGCDEDCHLPATDPDIYRIGVKLTCASAKWGPSWLGLNKIHSI